jgi:chorismate synthase
MSNSAGVLFRITSFGESHGPSVGVVIDGCPAGLPLDAEDIQKEVDKRKPAPAAGGTPRSEEDRVEILSGIFNGRTTGAPLTMLVRNRNVESAPYDSIRFTPRPGHADYTAFVKYGGFNDHRGGGRFSGRVTVGLVMAGAVAKKLLDRINIEVLAYTAQIGHIKAVEKSLDEIRQNVYRHPLRCADLAAADKMSEVIRQAAEAGDSLGGLIEGLALNLPAGLGEPLFDTLEGELAKMLFAVPAVKGVEFGAGFLMAEKRGSQNNDPFTIENGKVVTETNNAGGILGGLSSGMPLVVRVVVKPTPSISQKQKTVDLQKMQDDTELYVQGRHDVCIVPRAVIVVESVIAVTLCDLALRAGILTRIIKG